jgi:protein-tyrosine phosphatase
VNNKVTYVVLLASDDECLKKTKRNLRELYTVSGMRIIYLPIQDFSVPDESELSTLIDRAIQLLQDGNNMAIHCSAGIGRTGTIAACLAKRVKGITGEQAINWIRQSVPGAVETDEQEQFILDFNAKEVA